MTFANLKVPVAGFLNLRWSPHCAPFLYQAEILGNPQHPLFFKTRAEVSQAPEKGLRWKIVTNMSKSALKKEVMRRRLKRRWQEAFRAAFKARGLDYHGRLLNPETKSNRQTDLIGTLEVHIYAGRGFDDPFHYLVEQADATLGTIAKKTRQIERPWESQSSKQGTL